MKNTMKAIERTTGNEYTVKRIEGGFEVYNGTELYKKLRESTFKKYFKLTGETATSEEPTPTTQDTVEKAKPVKAKAKPAPEAPTPEPELDPAKREKLIDKIRKVLKLAQDNPSMEEGLAAALQAQKLMAKYNIHEEEVTLEEIKDEISSVFSHQKHDSSFHSWRKQLAVIVAKNFRCKTYLKGGDVVFRGYKQDAQIALEVYLSLYAIGDKLGSKKYNEQLKLTGSGSGVYNSFTLGFLKGVTEGFDVQCTALMIVTPKEVEQEFTQFSAGFGKSKVKQSPITDVTAFKDGVVEGKHAVKAREIESK